MNSIPAVAFSAWSGSGKTTLIEQLVREFKQRGLRVAVIKHDAHGFDIDHEGKDTWRFQMAGADLVAISSPEKSAGIEQRGKTLEQLISGIQGMDIILIEGFKNTELPRIGIARKSIGKGFTDDLDRFIALVTDLSVDTAVPCFDFSEIQAIADFIEERFITQKCNGLAHSGTSASCSISTDHSGPPSLDRWLLEAKADPCADKIGMYLSHNGVVRSTAKARVREGNEGSAPVTGMDFSYDREKVESAIAETYGLDGIYYVRVWLNEGTLQVGDDIMFVLIGGDIRPHVVDALQFLVGKIKSECVTETELT